MKRSCGFWIGYGMFDAIGAFNKQFTPTEGGYLYYPSRKSGGKLVTAEEFEKLAADWERTAGRSGQWKIAGIVIVLIIVFTLVAEFVDLPDWVDTICTLGIVVGVSGRFLWAGFAPWRLVKDRAAVTQPRSMSQTRRAVRDLLNWPFIIFATLFSGTIFVSNLSVAERTVVSWLWLVGSGLILGVYLWVACQKLRDRRR